MRNRPFWQPLLVAGMFFFLTCPVSADVLFTLLPADGNVFGSPGSTVGWGYSLANNDPTNWFLTILLNSDSFANGTPSLLFDFPIVAPGATVSVPYDPGTAGLYELTWDIGAPVGFVNSGNF